VTHSKVEGEDFHQQEQHLGDAPISEEREASPVLSPLESPQHQFHGPMLDPAPWLNNVVQ
jgi:hypothetical protein